MQMAKKGVMVEEEEYRKTVKEEQSTWDHVLGQDQERVIQIQRRKKALAGQLLLQMKEKSLQKAEEKRQSEKDFEMLKNLDELHAQELRRQKEQKILFKEIQRKSCLEDISRMNTYREEQAEILRTEEERTKLARVDMEGKLLQREAEAAFRLMRPRLFSQTVSENLASLKKEQAATAAERDEQSFFNGLAKRQAEQEKQQKEKAEKNAEALQSISAHRQKMIQERQQREEAERQSNVAWLQSQIDADRAFLEGNKLKAERTRKERVQLQNFSDSLEAEKLPIQQTLTRKDCRTARHTLGEGLCFSCGEGSSYVTADTAATPLIHFGRANRKHQQDCKSLGKITSTIPDFHAMPVKNKAVDINDTKKQQDTVKVLTQGHEDMVQLCPTPPPAELRTDSTRSSRVRKLISRPEAVSVNQSSERSHLDRENQVMVEEEDRKTVKEEQSTWDKVLIQDQERDIQNQLSWKALAGQQLLQMKEKVLQKAQEKQQSKKDLEMLKNLDEIHAQELRRQEEQNTLFKEIQRKSCLEDISRMNTNRGEQGEILRTEEERTKLAHVDMEGKLLQREAEAAFRLMRPRLFSQTVSENLASLKKEQAAAAAERDEQSFFNCLAKRQAEQEKQQKEKAEKNAEALQSISAHRQKMIQERQQREEAERQSNVAWLQSQIDADRAFLEEIQLKAQRTRKERVQLQNFSDSLEAEKLPIQQTLTRKDCRTARHTLGGGLCFSCGEGSSYVTADTAATPLIHFGRANRKHQQDCKSLGKITSTIPNFHAMPVKNKAVDINDTKKQLDTVKVLTQGHEDMVQLCPTPPPAELRTDSTRSNRLRKLISRPEAVSVNQSLERSHLDRENQVMVEEEEDRKTVKEEPSTWYKVLGQDQERDIQNQLRWKALAGQLLLQMKEKVLQKAEEKQQSKKDLEMLKNLDELHAQELRQKEEQKTLFKEIQRKNCLEGISRMNTYREEQAEILRTEEERTKLARIDMEGKLLQREAEAAFRLMRPRLFSQTVSENLASLKKEQAAAAAERDEQSFFNGLAKRQAEQEKQQKEKAEKNAEALQSISTHRQNMIQERQQREEAERQSNVAWLQSQIDADRAFLEGNKLKASLVYLKTQRTRKDRGAAKHKIGGK